MPPDVESTESASHLAHHARASAAAPGARPQRPRRPVHWLLAMLVAATLMPANSGQAAESTLIYFPWVPHNEFAGGQGPWFSQIAFRNLSESFCPVEIFVGENGGWSKVSQQSIPGNGTNAITSSFLDIEGSGAPIRVSAPCAVTATLKQYAPTVNRSSWSDGASVVTGYNGVTLAEIEAAAGGNGRAWNLPIVQTNSDWNTLIRVSNLRSGGAIDATIELYAANNVNGSAGPTATVTQTIATAGTWQVDVSSMLGAGFIGYARVSTTGASGVLARRIKPDTDMAIINMAMAADSSAPVGTFRQAAPLLFHEYNGWNTGINIANVADRAANVTVRYYAAGVTGEPSRVESLVIPARSMRYLYTPDTVGDAGFVGSATIESDAPVVAAVDEVKYATGDALSYLVSGSGQQRAGLATVFKQDELLGRNDNSGINIANLDQAQAQTVYVDLQSASGASALSAPLAVEIPAGGNAFVYLPQLLEVPAGALLGALLTSDNPYGFVAISNDVNYAVPGDGSVVFSITGNDGTHIVTAAQP